MKTCKKCTIPFEITAEDSAFYSRIESPEPTLCPECRRMSIMMWRNERTLYSSNCAWCKKATVSCFSMNSPFQVLCMECWWGESFDPLKYGRDFDFNRPFFEQFWEHMCATPVGALFISSSENSDYSNYAVSNKNCYMVAGSDYNEDSFYADNSNKNRDVCDVSFVNTGELLYECIDSVNCYQCIASQNLKNCNFCTLSLDLIGCSNCIGCTGLRNAEYYIFNKKMSKEEYQNIVREMKLDTASGFQKAAEAFNTFKLAAPRRATNNLNAEASRGNYIVNSKNCIDCFDMFECDQCRYSIFGYHARDTYDVYGAPELELAYCVAGATTSYNIQFSSIVWPGSNSVYYSFLTRGGKNCLGCVSLNKNEYCIFNKQYSPLEYESLFKKIKEHMLKTTPLSGGQAGSGAEWGEFFPMEYSPWSYNETVANDYYPKTKDEALAIGARWEDQTPGTFGKETLSIDQIPDSITQVPQSFANEVFACRQCSRNYKVIAQELAFYKKMGVPFPRKCPLCRYKSRLQLRNPRTLWNRNCSSCGAQSLTTYSPDRPERILCEMCYNSLS